ncbi:putative GMC-type oxidoreductase [Megavirus courdo11]|uniref:GMC-type oxidoreductase n=3 Tax=Megamimivirinae TaxID=3044648 RepID=A0A2L2DNF4_MIMIV|nr:putative GMC-type oxidoreductase [Megavirus chiliensis]AEQ32825.1 GMC-type oxidoreductase [Megavirus chiliensis]AFX92985.1 putative GMC-type oxidoreductase [Megavirus courdo11]AVG47711.1 GMC-type oxidoreductase [Acanthamoeba polyphaga mimivirus]
MTTEKKHISGKISGDIIIIGAGGAGCVLAHYLARFSRHKIVLIEAGSWHLNDPVVSDPQGFFGKYNPSNENVSMAQNPEYSWQAPLQPDTGAYGKRPIIAHGMGVGGSTMVNRLNLVVGGRTVFDQDWPESWKYDNVKKYFQRILADINPIRDNSEVNVTNSVLDALRILAQQQIDSGTYVDFMLNKATGNVPNVEKTEPGSQLLNLNDPEGINSVVAFSNFYFGVNKLADGTYIRKYGANTYLNNNYVDSNGHGIGEYSNLRVLADCVVDRIIFKHRKAVGVNIIDINGNSHYVKAKQEIVVSGGAFYTPTILQRSGIGDFDHLSKIGVQNLVYHNSLVGTGLKNHYSPISSIKVNGTSSEISKFLSNMTTTPENMGFKGVAELGYHRLDPNKPSNANEVTYRKYQCMVVNGPAIPSDQQFIYNISSSTGNYFGIITDDVRFAPEGYVKIATPNIPRDAPKIFFNTFTNYTVTNEPAVDQWPRAQKTLSALISAFLGYDIVYQIVQQMNIIVKNQGFNVDLEIAYPPNDLVSQLHDGLELYGENWWHYLVPGLALNNNSTNAEKQFADVLSKLSYFPRSGAHLDSHQGCTCAIGRVVDEHLRVIGTENLRVVDLSAAPFLPGGNTWATASMIGARGVDIILKRPVLQSLPLCDVPKLPICNY